MNSDRWVVIDDTDPDINYQGSWFEDNSGNLDSSGNFGPPYLETLHGTSENGTVSLQFNGTGVSVIGTIAVANASTNPDPWYQCFIDDVSFEQEVNPFPFTENNWGLCTKTGIPDGLHTLRVDVKVQSSNNTYWLDQIRYIPSPNLPLDNMTIFAPNTDPAIQYDAQWSDIGDIANMTTQTNSVAEINFVGVSLSWYAYIPTELPHTASQASWNLDNGALEGQVLLKGLPTDATESIYNQLVFTTPEVDPGPHSLVVTFLGSQKTTPLVLTYLYIQNGSFPNLSSTPILSSSGPSGPSSPAPGASESPSGTPGVEAHSGGGTSGKSVVGAVLGGVLGGLAFFICIAGLLLFWRRRIRDRKSGSVWFDDGNPTTMAQVNGLQTSSAPRPFMGATSGTSQPLSSLPSKWQQTTGYRGVEQPGYYYHDSDFSHSRTGSGAMSSLPRTTTPAIQETESPQQREGGDPVNQPLLTEESPPRYAQT